ncbi:DUF11 domain-containing protein [Methanobrevibacter sp.]|uniref:DUF11 domain-containing protein n=1 Tax=Methanobrevibacter sp. TaxID=66852 RepID=UPI0025ED3657|nr:DUF11 domain-containing protein [Methanobrevibacter sp.]MBQ2831299.1 DUF11 domain-containing protein [Methanobrevibacter sp.]
MSLKTNMLKIGVVIALIFMLLPVIAAEDVDNSAYTESADDGNVVQVSDDQDVSVDDTDNEDDDDTETEVDDDEVDDDIMVDAAGEGVADLEVIAIAQPSKVKVGDMLMLGVLVTNNGPDTADNVIVKDLIFGDLLYFGYVSSQGEYSFYDGIWDVGDLEAGESAILYVFYKVVGNKDIIFLVEAYSDTLDPNPYNNIALAYADVVGGDDGGVQEPATMPAAGNPIALAILALMSIVGVSLKRRF